MYATNQPPADRGWRKSSYSGTGDNCVETAHLDGEVGVRDSKNPGGGILRFSRRAWAEFIGGIKAGQM